MSAKRVKKETLSDCVVGDTNLLGSPFTDRARFFRRGAVLVLFSFSLAAVPVSAMLSGLFLSALLTKRRPRGAVVASRHMASGGRVNG